ncbi:hypothetical protein HG530_009354 [Fusarium avenaceum]|nr:hypothetical protein HG530_009354 [Fusarium avenaceum]
MFPNTKPQRLLTLLPNKSIRIAPKHNPHRHTPPLPHTRAREDLHDDLCALLHIARLVVIRDIQHAPRLARGRALVVVHGHAVLADDFAACVEETCAEVARLYDRGYDVEWLDFLAEGFGEGRYAGLDHGVDGECRAASP